MGGMEHDGTVPAKFIECLGDMTQGGPAGAVGEPPGGGPEM